MAKPIKVLFVDDSPDITDALELLVGREQDLLHVGTLPQADDLLRTLETLRPDVAVVDLTMAGVSPLTAVREASVQFPQSRVIAYSGHDAPERIQEVFDAGAWGFVAKHSPIDSLMDAIRRVARGEIVTTLQ